MPKAEGQRALVALGVVVAGMLAWELARLGVGGIGGPASMTAFASSLIRAALLLVPAGVVARRVFRQRLVSAFWLGLPERAGLPRALVLGGSFTGAVLLLSHLLSDGIQVPSLSAAALALLLFNSAVEEALFRGFLLSELRQAWSPARAQVATALLFLAAHTRLFAGLWSAGAGVEIVPMVLVLGLLALVLGGAASATRSIWISVIIHSLNNFFAG
jgi:membrane protease YdiL (CAAX protease family)